MCYTRKIRIERRPTESRRTSESWPGRASPGVFASERHRVYPLIARRSPPRQRPRRAPRRARAGRGRQQVRQKAPSSATTTTRRPPPSRRRATRTSRGPRPPARRPRAGHAKRMFITRQQIGRRKFGPFALHERRCWRCGVEGARTHVGQARHGLPEAGHKICSIGISTSRTTNFPRVR